MNSPFEEKQLKELDKSLDPRFVSDRKGASGRKLKYLEGHDAIDQADRIFGYGQWGYEVLSCEQTIIIDPIASEPIGVCYKAKVRLDVRGCIPIFEVGSQPVSVCSVEDHVMGKRRKEASDKNGEIDTSPFNSYEISLARTIIMEAHEQAEKGAVTDAVKRALRVYGEQFGNGLYGDGRIPMIDGDSLTESDLKADWSTVYKVPDNEIESRWPKFIVWALQEQVSQLTAAHKVALYSKIDAQKKKTKSA
jgi:recombination DNA repair RAD52 pathway protein